MVQIGLNPEEDGKDEIILLSLIHISVILTGINQDKHRLEVAKTLGIDYCVNQQEEDLKALVMKLTDGYGADVVVEASGAYPSLNTCLDIVKKTGTISQMGVFHGPSPDYLDLGRIQEKEIRIQGTLSQKPTAWRRACLLYTSSLMLAASAQCMAHAIGSTAGASSKGTLFGTLKVFFSNIFLSTAMYSVHVPPSLVMFGHILLKPFLHQ